MQAALHLLVDGIELRQAERGDERAAQHCEADAASVRREAREKRVLCGFAHRARLMPARNRRMPRRECVDHLREVFEAAEEAQVIAGRAQVLRGDHVSDGAHLQLLRDERRLDFDAHVVSGQPERIGIKMRGRERHGKQRHAMRASKTRREMRHGNHVAHTELRASRVRAGQGDVEDRVRSEALRDAREMRGIEVEAQDILHGRVGLFAERFGHQTDRVAQRAQKRLGYVRVCHVLDALRLLRAYRIAPLARDSRKRTFDERRRGAAHRIEGRSVERRRIHAARAIDEIVRLVTSTATRQRFASASANSMALVSK